jgi:hypothetical protein
VDSNPYMPPKAPSVDDQSCPKFWPVAVTECILAAIGVCAWFYLRTAALFAGPPMRDEYAQSWGFQAIAFAVFRLPPAVVVVAALLAAQRRWLRRYHAKRGRSSSSSPAP